MGPPPGHTTPGLRDTATPGVGRDATALTRAGELADELGVTEHSTPDDPGFDAATLLTAMFFFAALAAVVGWFAFIIEHYQYCVGDDGLHIRSGSALDHACAAWRPAWPVLLIGPPAAVVTGALLAVRRRRSRAFVLGCALALLIALGPLAIIWLAARAS